MEEKIIDEEVEKQTATPAEQPKYFTQEEVNKIVSDRLKKYKAKATEEAAAEIEAREKDFRSREARLTAKEYIQERGYPSEMVEMLDTSDIEQFKKNADRLYSSIAKNTGAGRNGVTTLPMADAASLGTSRSPDRVNENAFTRSGSKHVPGDYYKTGW